MSVIKEWKCAKHGHFEGTHAICPEMGCISENVERVFLTPVSVSAGKYARFDKGLRRTSEMMGIPNWKTAREGETAFAGRAPLGQELLWGKDVEKVMGVPFAQQVQAAAAPLRIPRLEAENPNDPYLRVNNGMRATANTTRITQHPLPRAEVTRSLQDGKAAA